MKSHISFGSIEQFRNAVKTVQHRARYAGKDETGEPIYDHNRMLPVVSFTATEKIHGTNSGFCFNEIDGYWVQSKSSIITTEKDNYGCARWCGEREHEFVAIIKTLAEYYDIDLRKNTIALFFEYAGGSIQKLSALSGVEKKAIIFQYFKVSPFNEDEESYWIETKIVKKLGLLDREYHWLDLPSSDIFNIMKGKTWKIDIDFEEANLSVNEMNRLVHEEVEPASPLGKIFGQEENVGEGLVFQAIYDCKLVRFKVKGEKHSKSKVKKLEPVDEAKEKAKIDFANLVCTPARLEQAWEHVFGINNEKQEPDIKFTGDIIRAVITDVRKEESDILAERGLVENDVNKLISKITQRWFHQELNNG